MKKVEPVSVCMGSRYRHKERNIGEILKSTFLVSASKRFLMKGLTSTVIHILYVYLLTVKGSL